MVDIDKHNDPGGNENDGKIPGPFVKVESDQCRIIQ
jgi:hypothetical protein